MVRKLDELGRIVIPIETRKALNIVQGTEINIEEDGEKIILTKAKKQTCHACEAKIGNTDKYCSNCGAKL